MSNCKECQELKQAENEELKRINKANAKSFLKFWFKFRKYKQTLIEIKEIAENCKYKNILDVIERNNNK